MLKISDQKPYNLEERTYKFAKDVRIMIQQLSITKLNIDDFRQVIRSSSSIGANYIEANGALSKKDLLYRLRISRKEAKETHFWLKLIADTNQINDDRKIRALSQEAFELMKIFSSIIEKVKG